MNRNQLPRFLPHPQLEVFTLTAGEISHQSCLRFRPGILVPQPATVHLLETIFSCINAGQELPFYITAQISNILSRTRTAPPAQFLPPPPQPAAPQPSAPVPVENAPPSVPDLVNQSIANGWTMLGLVHLQVQILNNASEHVKRVLDPPEEMVVQHIVGTASFRYALTDIISVLDMTARTVRANALFDNATLFGYQPLRLLRESSRVCGRESRHVAKSLAPMCRCFHCG